MRVAYVETLICVNSFERKDLGGGGVNYATVRAVNCKLNANNVTHLGHVSVSVRATVCGLQAQDTPCCKQETGIQREAQLFAIFMSTFLVRIYVRNVCVI
jgi:hypothetical protein